MKAIIIEAAGGIENFQYKDIAKPSIKENEVLIETKAISINPVDCKVRANEGLMTMIIGEKRPAILGWDVSGIVVAKGSKVDSFEIGDRVFGMVNFVGSGSAYAEFIAAPENQLAKIPENISLEEAAASTLAALTALQVLRPRVKKGDKVLIHAGAGGVGHFAIQIAKSLGAYVIATSSPQNKDFILGLGADQHIDYQTQKLKEVLSDLDFVFDMFNGDILLKSVSVVKNSGVIISLPTPEFSDEIMQLAKAKNVDVSFLMVQSNGEDMNAIKDLLAKGTVKAHVSKTFTFEEMGKAHTQVESGRTVGKVVVTL